MQNFTEVLASLGLASDFSGWSEIQPQAISDDGLTIVGFGASPNGGQEGFVANLSGTAIPEPKTYLMFATICLASCFWAYRNRRNRHE